jgi:hypothetical protein
MRARMRVCVHRRVWRCARLREDGQQVALRQVERVPASIDVAAPRSTHQTRKRQAHVCGGASGKRCAAQRGRGRVRGVLVARVPRASLADALLHLRVAQAARSARQRSRLRKQEPSWRRARASSSVAFCVFLICVSGFMAPGPPRRGGTRRPGEGWSARSGFRPFVFVPFTHGAMRARTCARSRTAVSQREFPLAQLYVHASCCPCPSQPHCCVAGSIVFAAAGSTPACRSTSSGRA